jgi:dipeptidase E
VLVPPRHARAYRRYGSGRAGKICRALTTPGGNLKLLLTSAGIKNTSIHDALVDLLGKPIAESSALCVPTAIYAFPGGARIAWRLISGRAASPLCELGWKSLGVLELTALPSIERAHWTTEVQKTDALLVGGGDPLYLCHWIHQSGLADLFPTLDGIVWVGVSAGSLVMAPNVGKEFVYGSPPTGGGDRGLGLVDFAMFPHLDHEAMPDHSMANAEQWAAGVPVPGYAIDDETAVKVVDGTVEVVSEGHWKLFTP